MKVIFFIVFISNFLFSQVSDDFSLRQGILLKVKSLIKKEELVFKAYEKYLLKNFVLPSSINTLKTEAYLGDKFLEAVDENYFNNLTLDDNSLNYGLKAVLKNDTYIKNLYESDTFRKNSFFKDDKIHFIFENDLSKVLFYLNKYKDDKHYFEVENDHIKVYETSSKINLLLSFRADKYKTGPMVISNDRTKHNADIFKILVNGTILYDENGVKFVKTQDSLEILK